MLSIWLDTNTEHKFLLLLCGEKYFWFIFLSRSHVFLEDFYDVLCNKLSRLKMQSLQEGFEGLAKQLQHRRWCCANLKIVKFLDTGDASTGGTLHICLSSLSQFPRNMFDLKVLDKHSKVVGSSIHINKSLILSATLHVTLVDFLSIRFFPCATENHFHCFEQDFSEAANKPICIWIGKRVDFVDSRLVLWLFTRFSWPLSWKFNCRFFECFWSSRQKKKKARINWC